MGLLSKARVIRGEPEKPVITAPPMVSMIEREPSEKKKKKKALPKVPPPVPANRAVVKPAPAPAEKLPELAPIPEPVDEFADLKTLLWGLEYEGKEGLAKLKKVADTVGVKYDASWGKGRIINEVLGKSNTASIRNSILAQKEEEKKAAEKKKEEKIKAVLPIPETDEEARNILPLVFWSKNEMIAAADAYGLDLPTTNMNMADITEFMVGMGKEVWEDLATMDHTDVGELLSPEFGLKSFGKGSKDKVDEAISEYRKEMKEGNYTFMMDSKGEYHRIEAATRITVNGEEFVRFAFGPELNLEEIRKNPDLGPAVAKEVEERRGKPKVAPPKPVVAPISAPAVSAKPATTAPVSEEFPDTIKKGASVSAAAPVPAPIAVSTPAPSPVKKVEVMPEVKIEKDMTEDQIAKVATSILPPSPKFKPYLILTPDSKMLVRDIVNEDVDNQQQLYEWDEKFRAILKAQEGKIKDLPPRSAEKKAQTKLVEVLKGFKDTYRNQLEMMSWDAQLKTRDILLAEIKKRGVKSEDEALEIADNIGMSMAEPAYQEHIWDKPFSYVVDLMYGNYYGEEEPAVVKEVSKEESKTVSKETPKVAPVPAAEKKEVKAVIVKEEKKPAVAPWDIMSLQERQDVLDNSGFFGTEVEEYTEMSWDDLPKDVRENVIIGKAGAPKEVKIAFTYGDISQKKGPFVGYPMMNTYKAKLKELGITNFAGKNDPLWIELQKNRAIPVDMIKRRLAGEPVFPDKVVAPAAPPKPVVPKEPVPAKFEVSDKQAEAMRKVLQSLSEDELAALDQAKEGKEKWHRDLIVEEMTRRKEAEEMEEEGRIAEIVKKMQDGEIDFDTDLDPEDQEDVKLYLESKMAQVQGEITAEVPIPETVKLEVKEAYDYDDILVDGVPNYFRFLAALKNMDFDVSNSSRNKQWFAAAQRKKKIPSKGEEVFKETWNEFQHRVAMAYADFLPKNDKERIEKVKDLWKEYGQKGEDIPPFKGSNEIMSHREWIRLYCSRPYDMDFIAANKAWKKYGLNGKLVPEKELRFTPKVAKWVEDIQRRGGATEADFATTAEDINDVLDWINEYKVPISYGTMVEMFGNVNKARKVWEDMHEVTYEGQVARFKSYFTHISNTDEGQKKLKFMALEMGGDLGNTKVMDYLLTEQFGTEGERKYDVEIHQDAAKEAFNAIVPELFKTKESHDEFAKIWTGDKIGRDLTMKDEMDQIDITAADIDAVPDNNLAKFDAYAMTVYGRDVGPEEFFAAYPEMSRKEAKAAFEKAMMIKSAVEYGQAGRKPLGETQLAGVITGIVKSIEDYKLGESKNRLAKKMYDLGLFNREWKRRHGVQKIDTVNIDQLGVLTLPEAEKFSMGAFTKDMLPASHVEKVKDYMRKNLKVPTREDLLEIIPDPAEANYILINVVYTDMENILNADSPYQFSDEEVSKMAIRKGLSGSSLRRAMQAWNEHRQLPMDAAEAAQKEFAQRQKELNILFEGTVKESGEVRKKLKEIIALSPDRSSAITKISAYIEDMKGQIRAKESDVAILTSGLEEQLKKQRKSEEVKKEIADAQAQIDKDKVMIAQLRADIQRAESDIKYRIYKEIPEDYTFNHVRFAKTVGDIDEEYSNFINRKVEVVKGEGFPKRPSEKAVSEYVHVNLDDIFNYWITPIEQGIDKVIKEKAQSSTDAYFKENYDRYTEDAEQYNELVGRLNELSDEMKVEGISEGKLEEIGEEIETAREVLSRIDREQRARMGKLVTYVEMEKIEPSIKDIVADKTKTGNWPEDSSKKMATIAFMNKARELGLYDYMYQMTEISRNLDPPLHDIPLTIYPSQSAAVREALFGEWLEQALTEEDIGGWDPKTIAEFIGDDWEQCRESGTFGSHVKTEDFDNKSRREKSARDNTDVWRDCAIRKAKVIQSQAIAKADPLVLQPVITKVPIESVDEVAAVIKENVKLKEMQDKLLVTANEQAEMLKELHKKGVPTVVVTETGKKPKIEAAAATPKDKTLQKMLNQINVLQQQINEYQDQATQAVNVACGGNEKCKTVAMAQITKPAKAYAVPKREFCFTVKEWETILLALSERKEINSKQLKKNKKLLDRALDAGITRDVPLYQNIDTALNEERKALDNLEDFIKKFDSEAFICSQEEMIKIRNMDIQKTMEGI